MFRCYFNSRAEYPYIWSVETEDGEETVRVRDIVAKKMSFKTAHNMSVDNVNRPIAWIEVEASEVKIMEDIAYFT